MSVIDKLIKKIERKPISKDITLLELQTYLTHYGFKNDRVNGSHNNYVNKERGLLVTIPCHGKEIKAIYIKLAVEAVLKVRESEGV